MRIKYNLPKIKFKSLRRIFQHFGGHLKKHKMRLFVGSMSLLGVTLLSLLRPWPLKIVFDFILIKDIDATADSALSFLNNLEPMEVLFIAAFGILLIAVLRGLLTYTYGVYSKIIGHNLVANIRMQLFSHVQRLPLSYHDYRETGELMTRMTSDISLLQDLLISMVINLASQIILIVCMFGIMFWLDWQLAAIALAALPFFALAAIKFSFQIKDSARKQRLMYGKIVASVQETFAGISQVKTYSQEKRRERLIGRSIDKDVTANVKTAKLTANYARIVDIITAVGMCAVLWVGTNKALANEITPGDLLIFLSYLRGIYRPLKTVAQLSSKIAKATVRGEKTIELLEMEPEILEKTDGLSAKEIKGDIQFKSINFSYNSEQKILKDFSCTIPQNKTTIIFGPTGAGKSTIAKLILRLYKPSDGEIIIDDKNIDEYKVRSLRKRITPLAQETFLFRTSIAENIAFSKNSASQEQIVEAAKLAGAHEFIMELGNGYETMVGEGGLTLSGGQRQKISFARAAMRNSPVMIFDEPATGLDVHAEKDSKNILAQLKQNRTMLIITHRINFLSLADWVIFINDGRMVEQGTPQELFEKNGEFKKFFSIDERMLKEHFSLLK